jgi:hypothetical protein
MRIWVVATDGSALPLQHRGPVLDQRQQGTRALGSGDRENALAVEESVVGEAAPGRDHDSRGPHLPHIDARRVQRHFRRPSRSGVCLPAREPDDVEEPRGSPDFRRALPRCHERTLCVRLYLDRFNQPFGQWVTLFVSSLSQNTRAGCSNTNSG